MKTNVNWLLAFGWLFLAVSTAQAQFDYSTNGNAITITGYTGSGGAVTIPPEINGFPVTSIGSGAFYEGFEPPGVPSESIVTAVVIPSSVTNIGSYAFEDCNYLTTVTLGNGLISIDADAFSGCTTLSGIASLTA